MRVQVDKAVMAASVNLADIPAQTGVSDEFVAILKQMYGDLEKGDNDRERKSPLRSSDGDDRGGFFIEKS